MNFSDAYLEEKSRKDVEAPLLAEGGTRPVNYTRAVTQRSGLDQNSRPRRCLHLFFVPDVRHYTAAVPILSAVVFIIPGIVLVTSFVECKNFHHCTVSLSTTENVSLVLMGISCILLIVDVKMNLKHWSARDTRKSETKHLKWMAVIIGLGALAYTITETISDNGCQLQDQPVVSLAYGIGKCLFIVLLLSSVCLHYNQTSHSCFCAITVAVVMGVAASVAALEIALEIVESSALNGTSVNSQAWLDCVSAHRYVSFFIKSSPYLFPFLVQFMLLTAYLLFKGRQGYGKFTYQNATNSLNIATQRRSHLQLSVSQRELSSQERDNSSDASIGTQQSRSPCGKQTDVGMFVGIVWAIGFAVTIFLTTFDVSREQAGVPTAYRWYYVVKISTGIAATLSAVVGCSILSSVISCIEVNNVISLIRLRKRGLDTKSVDYWLSVVSLLSLLVYQGFSLLAAAVYESPEKMGWSSYAGPVGWKTVDCAIRLLEAVAQFFLIIRVTDFFVLRQRNLDLKLNDRHRAMLVLQQFILFLISCNICFWASDGVFRVRIADRLPLELNYYSPFVWYLISHTFFPLEIFFHLHSAILLFKFWSCTITAYRSCRQQCNLQE